MLFRSLWFGEKHGMSVLTEKQVLLVVKLKSEGLTYPEIYRKTGIKKSTAAAIITGRNWGYLTGIKHG